MALVAPAAPSSSRSATPAPAHHPQRERDADDQLGQERHRRQPQRLGQRAEQHRRHRLAPEKLSPRSPWSMRAIVST